MVPVMNAYQHTGWAYHAASSSQCCYHRDPRSHRVGPGRMPNNLIRLSHRDFNEDRPLAFLAAGIFPDQQHHGEKKTKLSAEALRNRDLDRDSVKIAGSFGIAPLHHQQLRQKRILSETQRIRGRSQVSVRFSRFGPASSLEQQQAKRPTAFEARRVLSARAMAAAAAEIEAGVDDSGGGGGSGAPTASEVGSWHDEAVERVLWSAEEIDRRVEELATAITADFPGESLVVVGVGRRPMTITKTSGNVLTSGRNGITLQLATGAFVFLADLVRKLKVPVTVDLIRVRSYGTGAKSSGVANVMTDVHIEVENKHVILVDDIIDTGITLSALVAHFAAKGVATLSVCALLDKKARRVVPLQLADGGKFYSGFECPDAFVVGYGMDYAENFRSLPYVGALKRHVYEKN